MSLAEGGAILGIPESLCCFKKCDSETLALGEDRCHTQHFERVQSIKRAWQNPDSLDSVHLSHPLTLHFN
jgi:hypothetical protein